MDAKAIGERLVVLRGNKTQEAVAIDLGISKSAIAMYEKGERVPRDNIKLKIARYYNLSVQSIFFVDKEH